MDMEEDVRDFMKDKWFILALINTAIFGFLTYTIHLIYSNGISVDSKVDIHSMPMLHVRDMPMLHISDIPSLYIREMPSLDINTPVSITPSSKFGFDVNVKNPVDIQSAPFSPIDIKVVK